MAKVTEEIKEAYNKIADQYSRELWDDMPYNEYLDQFASLIKGNKVLDLGCAMGSFTKYISDMGFSVDGIDISENFIAIAKQKVKTCHFYVMDMLKMNLNKKYNGIMCINSSIHIEKKNMLFLFKEIKSMLEEDGVVLIILQEGEGEKYIKEPFDETVEEFVSFYTPEEIEEVFHSAGFTILKKYKIKDDAEFELGNDQLAYILK